MTTYTTGIDLETLCKLAQGAARILEFGTAAGETTLALARACPLAEVLTVDVSRGTVPAGTFQECDLRPTVEIGAAFRGTPEAARITQFICDALEPYCWHWPCDFVFVDALHSFDGVVKDTMAALAMVRPGGMIVWDDFLSAGVPVVLAALAKIAEIVHVAGTRMSYVRIKV